ncbi:expressed unknown protein [Seminavis robusta]|uniref:Response regulatory domain-containing protein n=1 Tax=Seminavis robusta TaxID=568900 RepID=A0A9N8EJQ6_9STRA|nr:expressed unknown protein [Seminavis robusta]|eukprot:Sro1360_g266070.1 n/a (340) ;mRNA; r:11964-12983
MCRASFSPAPAVVHPNIALVPASNATKQVDVSSAKKVDRKLVSILHPSSYDDSCNPLKSCKSTTSVPGLVAVRDVEESSAVSRGSSTDSLQDSWNDPEHVQEPPKPKLSFHPRVVVHEFHRLPGSKQALWYSGAELREFQREAVSLVQQHDRKHWSGFFRRGPAKFSHCHPALGFSSDDSDDAVDQAQDDQAEDQSAANQVRRILIVDTHDLSLKLLAKGFQRAFPRATVSMAKRSNEAMDLCQIEGNYYDIVVVEERLSLFWNRSESGSAFLRSVLHLRQTQQWRPLCIGLSAHIDCDRATLKESGADICWCKPPPDLKNSATVRGLLEALKAKRSDD